MLRIPSKMSSIPVACGEKRRGMRATRRTQPRNVPGKQRNQMRSGIKGGDVPENSGSGATERCRARAGCGLRRANRTWRQPMRTAAKTAAASRPAAIANTATWNSVSLARPGVASQLSNASSTGASRAAKSSATRARRRKDPIMKKSYRTQAACAARASIG